MRAADEAPRNFAALVLHQAIVRIGWIFKTESVIVPAFLDAVSGSAGVRGLLPVLSRVGQSVPPFLLAPWLQARPRKRGVFAATTLGMALPFLLLAALVGPGGLGPGALATWCFLAVYTVFFAAAGLNMLVATTLQGKLIPPDRRGRLLAVGTVAGMLPAVAAALWLMPGWLALPGMAGWAAVFGFTGACFTVAACVPAFLREPRDTAPAASERSSAAAGALALLRRDAAFRRLVCVSALFTFSLTLLPHYQALARERVGLAGGQLMIWVVVQSLAVAAASAVVGPLADRLGNRLLLRGVIFTSAAVPPLALWISQLPAAQAARLFPLVFLGIGVTPIALRLFANYCLEVVSESEHTRALSLLSLCNASVMVASPALGLAVDAFGFDAVFLGVAAVLAGAGGLTFALREPRFE